jgi:Conjugal transfer protein TrbL
LAGGARLVAATFLLSWLARLSGRLLGGLVRRLVFPLWIGAVLLATPVAGPLVLRHLPAPAVHAQEAPGDASPDPGGGARGSGDLTRFLADVLGGVRNISDATRSVADFTTRLSATDWKDLTWGMLRFIGLRLLQVVAAALRHLVDGALSSQLNFISRTPETLTYQSPTVLGLWGRMRQIANAGLALVAFVGGLNVILNRRLGTPYHDAFQFLPRLAVGAVLANTSAQWTGLAIWANNQLCDAIGHASLPGLEQTAAELQALADIVLAIVYLAVGLLLISQMLLRLALLDLLVVVSPLALLLWVLPQTEGWWRRWSTAFTGAVFAQFVQVGTLKLAGGLLRELSGSALLSEARILYLLLAITSLVLTLKVPSLLNAYAGDGLDVLRQLTFRAAERLVLPVRGWR